MSRRYGKFSISVELIRTNPEFVRRVMGECVIVRAEHMFINDCIEYHAESPMFEEVECGFITPEYEWVVSGDVLEAVKRP